MQPPYRTDIYIIHHMPIEPTSRKKKMEKKRARKRLVLVPVPAQGHISPMMQLAKTLHLKGFSITVAQTKFNYFNPPDDSTDFQFVTIPESLPESDFKNLGPIRFLHKLNKECQVSFKDCLGQLLIQQSHEIACVIYDEFMYFAEAAAKEFNLPNVIFSTTSATAFACRSEFEKLYAENALVPFNEPKEEQNELVPEFHPSFFCYNQHDKLSRELISVVAATTSRNPSVPCRPSSHGGLGSYKSA